MQLSGSITALATPFAADGSIDYSALDELVSRQLAAGTHGLVVAGSTGEAAMLTDDEYSALVARVATRVAGRCPVLAGCGQSGTARTIEQTRRALRAGADVALVVVPPYVRPTQAGLIAHYSAVAAQGGLPLVLYNVPSRSACDLLPVTVAELAPLPGVIGIKEALPDARRIGQLAALSGPGFALLGGDDPTVTAAIRGGATGLVSVASNVAPASMRRLLALLSAGAGDEADELAAQLGPLFEFLGCAPNPIPLKAIMAQLGLCSDVLRLPLLPLAAQLRGPLAAITDALLTLEAQSAG